MTLIILLLGLGVGVLVGLLGIGGGVVLVPATVYLLGMGQHMAQGTSLFILLPPIGLGALREYWKQGQVDLRAGILCALGMLFGAYAGSLVALPMPSRNLKGLFGCFLVEGTSLLILLPPIGLGALREYWKQGQVDLRAGILCAAGILVGAYGGSLVALPLASRHLKGLFGCFLVLSAVLLWRKTQLEGKPVAAKEETDRG